MTALDHFLQICAAEIKRRALVAHEYPLPLGQGATAFAVAVESATPISQDQSTVPVAEHMSGLTNSSLTDALSAAADEISWTASYRMSDDGTEAALSPLDRVRDFGELTVGLMLVGPGCSYPEHAHPPQELYLPLSGDGQWMYGGRSDYRRLSADTLVYNNPNDRHGAHAPADEPLLALYVLWP